MNRYNFLEIEKEVNKKLAQEFNVKCTDFFDNKIKKCEEEQKKILNYVEKIPHLIIKATIVERLIKDKDWDEVGERIGYSVQQAHRYYKKALGDNYIKTIIKYLQ